MIPKLKDLAGQVQELNEGFKGSFRRKVANSEIFPFEILAKIEECFIHSKRCMDEALKDPNPEKYDRDLKILTDRLNTLRVFCKTLHLDSKSQVIRGEVETLALRGKLSLETHHDVERASSSFLKNEDWAFFLDASSLIQQYAQRDLIHSINSGVPISKLGIESESALKALLEKHGSKIHRINLEGFNVIKSSKGAKSVLTDLKMFDLCPHLEELDLKNVYLRPWTYYLLMGDRSFFPGNEKLQRVVINLQEPSEDDLKDWKKIKKEGEFSSVWGVRTQDQIDLFALEAEEIEHILLGKEAPFDLQDWLVIAYLEKRPSAESLRNILSQERGLHTWDIVFHAQNNLSASDLKEIIFGLDLEKMSPFHRSNLISSYLKKIESKSDEPSKEQLKKLFEFGKETEELTALAAKLLTSEEEIVEMILMGAAKQWLVVESNREKKSIGKALEKFDQKLSWVSMKRLLLGLAKLEDFDKRALPFLMKEYFENEEFQKDPDLQDVFEKILPFLSVEHILLWILYDLKEKNVPINYECILGPLEKKIGNPEVCQKLREILNKKEIRSEDLFSKIYDLLE
jgi:hypothetical protein